MDTKLDEKIQVTLPKGTLLILFQYLSQSYERWREQNGQAPDDSFFLLQPDAAERAALWQLEGTIERTLPEIFSADYSELIAQWKKHLASN